MTKDIVRYIGKFISLIIDGHNPKLIDPGGDSYVLYIETEDGIVNLEIKKDNRFGRKLDG